MVFRSDQVCSFINYMLSAIDKRRQSNVCDITTSNMCAFEENLFEIQNMLVFLNIALV